MPEYGSRRAVLEYNAKVEDVKDNMKSILEKVNAGLFIKPSQSQKIYCCLKLCIIVDRVNAGLSLV